jgi:hypothetical protein
MEGRGALARSRGGRRRRPGRTWLATGLATAVAMLCLASSAAAAEPFSFLQSPFTQELYGNAPSFFGGVAFAKNGDVWVDECNFGGGSVWRFSNATTHSEEGSTVHSVVEGSPFASDAGCGLTNNPDGFLYSNTSEGVSQINASTGAATGVVFGEAGDSLGITTDPQTGNLVYVGSNGTILTAAPGGASSVFSSATTGDFVDGVAFDPTGNFLFTSNRTLHLVTIIRRNGEFVQNSEEIPGEPDGIAFHALSPKFVVTNNNDGTMTRLDFPGNDYTKPPVNSLFASGGFRGDLTQVGPDGCDYVTQEGTRFGNANTSSNNSVVRICGGFAPSPGAESEITLTPKTASDPAGGEHTVTATVTEEGGKTPVSGAAVTFSVVGTNGGAKGTCTTSKGAADPGCETDETGQVRFTYKDANGAGEDTIEASVTVGGNTEHATATKKWIEEVVEGCTTVEGAIRVTINHERQTLGDNLSTELKRKPQRLVFTWENGLQKIKLLKLTSASCEVLESGKRKFSGEGTASLDGVPGFTVKFAIGATPKGANEATVTLFEGSEKVASFKLVATANEIIK